MDQKTTRLAEATAAFDNSFGKNDIRAAIKAIAELSRLTDIKAALQALVDAETEIYCREVKVGLRPSLRTMRTAWHS